jgi:acetyltransferase
MLLQDRVLHDRLARICHSDYDRDIPLVAERTDADGTRSILGIGRLTKIRGTQDGSIAVMVGDPYQGMGIGGELVRRVIDLAKREHLKTLNAVMTVDNQAMQYIFKNLGFTFEPTNDEKLVTARLEL